MCGDVETNPGPGSSSSKSTVEMFDDHSLSFLVGDRDFELEDELEDFERGKPKRMRFCFFAMSTSRSTRRSISCRRMELTIDKVQIDLTGFVCMRAPHL